MSEGLLILSLLIWLPVLFYGIARQGFTLILIWLLVAPVALRVFDKPGANPFFETQAKKQPAQVQPGQKVGYLSEGEARITLKELLEPTRILFGLFFIVFLGDAVLRRRRLGPFDATEKFALVFSLLVIASALFQSKRVAFSLRVACDAFIIPFIAYFSARRLVTNENQLRGLVRVIGYLGVYLIVTGLIERLTLSGLFSRVNGPFWSRNELYIVMAVVFFAVLADVLCHGRSGDERKALPRVIQLFVVCLAPVIVLFGWGRGNLVGLLSGIWMFGFLARRFLGLRPIMTTVGLALLLGPIIGLSVYELTPQEVIESRITRTATIYARIGAWENIAEEISQSPVFGIGLNNLRDKLEENRIRFEGVKSETFAHNSFLAMAGELGLLGLLVYLALVASIIRTGLTLYGTGSSPRERWRGIAVISIMIAYLVAALFDTFLYFPSVSHVYTYVFVGGIARLVCKEPICIRVCHGDHQSVVTRQFRCGHLAEAIRALGSYSPYVRIYLKHSMLPNVVTENVVSPSNQRKKSEYRNPKQTPRQIINLKSAKSKTPNPKQACSQFELFWLLKLFRIRISCFELLLLAPLDLASRW